jgi:hypothetical protein
MPDISSLDALVLPSSDLSSKEGNIFVTYFTHSAELIVEGKFETTEHPDGRRTSRPPHAMSLQCGYLFMTAAIRPHSTSLAPLRYAVTCFPSTCLLLGHLIISGQHRVSFVKFSKCIKCHNLVVWMSCHLNMVSCLHGLHNFYICQSQELVGSSPIPSTMSFCIFLSVIMCSTV